MSAELPAVLLLHGFATSAARTWGDNGWIDILGDTGRTVIAPDLMGHGDAPKPHDPEAYADLTTRIVDALPDRPVSAIGFSMGAITLLRLATREPHRFDRLLLAGIGMNVLSTDPLRNNVIIEALQAPPEAVADLDTVGRLFRQYAEQPGNDLAALTAAMQRGPSVQLTDDDFARVTCPVLLVIGDQDFAGPADPLAAKLPNATVKVLPRVDHFATTEAFGFIDAALDWVA
jgi:pimeloyl-ACP methyl ester carboxylesterase